MKRNALFVAGMTLTAVAAVLGLACSSGGGGGGGNHDAVTPNANDNTPSAGQALYDTTCLACHGTPGAGDGTAPELADYTPLQLHDGVTAEGHTDVGALSQDDFGTLAEYVGEPSAGGGGGDNANANGGSTPSNDNTSDGVREGSTIPLNVVKLNHEATTERGPAVGDGVLAFDAEGGAALGFARAGDTEASAVPAPAGMGHDRMAFDFAGRKLVVRDRYSGQLYVYDPDTEDVVAMPYNSINLGGIGGPNIWETDGNLVATANSWVVTDDGAHKLIKIVDVSNVNNMTITPFDTNPSGTPDSIDVDAEAGRVAVRASGTFYVYDVNTPNDAPLTFTRSTAAGGAGAYSVIRVWGIYVAFFDDDENFVLLNVGNGEFTQPARNPSRANRGLTVEAGRFACFLTQTEDDGSSIDQINRALFGDVDILTNLMDPAGLYVNGVNDQDGRVGFGATVAVSPSGRYVFVAGETAVGVDEQERLYVSVDGGNFQVVADATDALNAQRAAGVAASNNLVAFLLPAAGATSAVSVGYAVLDP